MSQERPTGRIFISYRRMDTQHIAGRLSDRLESRFGAGKVFMDVDSIEPGLDFNDAIVDAVGTCDVLLALIGRQWLNATDGHGRSRLHNPDDLVALEITAALDRGIRVIPVLVDGAEPPHQDDLTPKLAPLARRHAVRIDHATFNGDVGTLATALERAFAPQPGAEHRRPDPVAPYEPTPDRPRKSVSWQDWTVDDFTLVLRDRRPSSQRIVSILDVLAEQPEIEMSLTDLSAATKLNRSQLRGAFSGFTRVCGLLRPDTRFEWPILFHDRPSTRPDQDHETTYHVPTQVAHRWKEARSS